MRIPGRLLTAAERRCVTSGALGHARVWCPDTFIFRTSVPCQPLGLLDCWAIGCGNTTIFGQFSETMKIFAAARKICRMYFQGEGFKPFFFLKKSPCFAFYQYLGKHKVSRRGRVDSFGTWSICGPVLSFETAPCVAETVHQVVPRLFLLLEV